MEPSFWKARWAEGRIGFHEGKPNRKLERHAARIAHARRVLVPLCGKAIDLAYLAGLGHEVLGVELVEDAVRQFFDEQGVTPVVERRGGFVAYSAGTITVFAGDMFATDAALLGPIDAVYDRAALIALPPEMRPRYVAHVRALAAGAPILLVNLEYPQEVMEGPPFAVLEDEVRRLFAGAQIELIDDEPGHLLRLPPDVPCREKCFFISEQAP